MIFVDSNIPMYLTGAQHPNRALARSMVERAVLDAQALVTSAEVYQEIIHRFVAIGRRDAIEPTMDLLDSIIDEVASVEHRDVHAARDLVLRHESLSSRDALHVAVMKRLGCADVMTFDAGFDLVPGVVRVGA